MEIRLVRPGDHQALAELTVAAYEAVYAPAGEEMSDGYRDELRDVAGRAAGSDVLVAVDDDGTVLGGVAYVPGPDAPNAEFEGPDHAGIRMLAVGPAAQGRGVGEALTRACIDRARDAGKAYLMLHSTGWMTAAHRVYQRVGFEREPSLDWEPHPGLSLRAFRLKL